MVARKYTRNEDLMASLEWNWNMPYGTLHLNTRYNVFFAGAALHLHHDNDSWGLLPDKALIDQYYAALNAERSKFPDIQLPEDGFEYRLIPIGNSMKQYRILRQNDHTLPPNKDQYILHFYPFDTLPPFRSHLHPKFAILELGRKYQKLRGDDTAAAEVAFSSYPSLDRIHIIYLKWSATMTGLAFEEWKHQGGTEGDGDRQSESSSKTGYDSLRKGFKRRRTGNADEQGSPTPAGGDSDAMRMANLSSETLSHETLIEHEDIYGKRGWTSESLSSWAADASRHVMS